MSERTIAPKENPSAKQPVSDTVDQELEAYFDRKDSHEALRKEYRLKHNKIYLVGAVAMMALGLTGIYLDIEYSGWAIFISVVMAWESMSSGG